ncbi:TolC family protein [Myxococcus sp. K38C18041901]|uniref:TolC family protein n=1 Tax=Myxococcus guangdongensis TaxID=2906760 RepID=UPI0020A7B89C|nr:TolC family protein [Myxococcus guangdongensis]MCP3064177.1 TolC family protein [Myxococcus guangdongensis]
MRPTAIPLAVLFFVASAPALATRALTMEQSVALALAQSPRLIEGQAEAASAQAQLEGASRLLQGNPQLQAALGPRLRDAGNSIDLNLGLSQPLELFGQRGARKDAAQATLSARQSRLEALKVELAAEVRQAFGATLAAEQELTLAQDSLALAEEGRKAADDRLAAGAATHIEVNTARVELGRAQSARVRAERQRTQAHAELKLLLGLDPTEPITPDGELRAQSAPAPALASLVEKAASQRQDVKAARFEWEAAQAESRLARRQALPVPSLGVSYGREEDSTILQGTLGIDLPLFDRNQAARGVSSARERQARQNLAALERFARTEVELAFNRLQTAQAAADVFGGDVLSALQENLSLVTEAYRAGKVDFLQLLIIRREALDARRGYIEALEELNSAKAQLLKALGSIQ